MLNDIYNTGNIFEDLSKSIFITVPKMPVTIDCKHHQAIHLMSHITKVLLRILIKRARQHIGPEIVMKHSSFMRDKGARNAILMLRVQHRHFLEMLQECGIDGKGIRVIRNLCWEQSAAIKVQTELRQLLKIQ